MLLLKWLNMSGRPKIHLTAVTVDSKCGPEAVISTYHLSTYVDQERLFNSRFIGFTRQISSNRVHVVVKNSPVFEINFDHEDGRE